MLSESPVGLADIPPFGLGFRFYIELLGISSLGLFGWRGGV